eukprot:88696_1
MISLNKHSIDATVENRYASVIYSFAFKNPNQSGSSELKFEITIDTAAFISKFVANIDGILFIGHTKEKETAKKEYIAAKHKDENAILVSQPYDDIPNVFRIKTNIDSKSKIILKITIEQYLQKRFNFNELTIQILRNFERYNIRKKYAHIAFRLNVKDQSGIYDVSIPHASHGSITINERVTDTPNAFMMSGTIDAQHSWMNELVLKYKVKGEANDSVLLYDDTTHTFCHILSDIVTDCAINDEKDIFEGYGDDIKENVLIPRRVVFVIDRSGSMSGHKWNKTIAATVCALKRLRHGYDRYCIIHFDSAIESYPTSGLLLANADNIDQTITHLKLIQPRGSTDINSALLSGIDRITADIVQLNQTTRRNKDNFFMNQLIMITDGEPNSGVSDTHQIISNVSRANSLQSIDAYSSKICIFCFGIGADGNDSSWIKDLNHSFLRVLAANNNGFYKRIKQTKTDTLLNELFDVLSKPILTHIDIQYNDKYVNDLTQTRFDSLYAGNDIIICGRISADHITSLNVKAFALTGKEITAGKGNVICSKPTKICKVMKVHTDECSALDSSNVERIWAYLKLQQYAEKKLIINDMIEYDADERKTDDVLPLELALKYKFVTPWTSMVLVKKKDAKKMQNVQLCDEDDDEDEDSEEESSEESEEDRKNKKKKGKKGKSQAKSSKQATSKGPPPVQQQQAPPKQEPVVDLMGDLLGIAPSSQPAPAQPAANTGGGMDDLFGSFGMDNKPSNAAAYQGPPLSMVFDSSKGQGLEMNAAFERRNGQPTMIIQANNKMGNGEVSRIDIKFNKNYLGIQPTATVPLNGNIGANASQTAYLVLQLSQEPTPKNPLDLTVQMAARSVRSNAQKPPVTMFATQIPAEIFFDKNNPRTLTDRSSFLAEWRAIPNTEDQSQTLKQCKNSDSQVVKDIFLRYNCAFVADRQIPNRGVSLYFATTLKNVAILMEVSIATNGACRLVVKSKNKYLSYVVCQTAIKLVNS